MRIDDVQHGFLLMVDDEAGNPVAAEEFTTIDALNTFIGQHRDEYAGMHSSLAFEEIADGKFGGYCISFDLPAFEPVPLRRLREMAREYAEDLRNPGLAPAFQPVLMPYRDDACCPGPKGDHLRDVSFVCPRCYHPVETCTCRHYPYYLVQVDTALVPVLRVLNTKGYRTTSCCAGHLDGRCVDVHVGFDRRYSFLAPLPEGATYWQMRPHVSFALLENPTPQEFAAYQRQAIDGLLTWANALPELPARMRTENLPGARGRMAF